MNVVFVVRVCGFSGSRCGLSVSSVDYGVLISQDDEPQAKTADGKHDHLHLMQMEKIIKCCLVSFVLEYG